MLARWVLERRLLTAVFEESVVEPVVSLRRIGRHHPRSSERWLRAVQGGEVTIDES